MAIFTMVNDRIKIGSKNKRLKKIKKINKIQEKGMKAVPSVYFTCAEECGEKGRYFFPLSSARVKYTAGTRL